jgi:hypothetical protein
MKQQITINHEQFLLTASGAGKLLGGITGAAVVALARRGQLPCVRDSSGRRLFAAVDVVALRKKRLAKRGK